MVRLLCATAVDFFVSNFFVLLKFIDVFLLRALIDDIKFFTLAKREATLESGSS